MKIKKYDLVPALLLVYLAVMVVLGYPDYVAGATSPWLYFGGTAFTVVVIILLRFNLKKRTRLRNERMRDIENTRKKEEADNANKTDSTR